VSAAPPEIFTTIPPFDPAAADYGARVAEVSRWSDRAGCRGTLVYTDNSLLDPWIVAHVVVESTAALRPLVAVQPVYMHPYTVAKLVTTLASLYGRGVDLNLVAGGFTRDLEALGDATPHDQRYDRLIDYARVVTGLLGDGRPVTYEGAHYSVTALSLRPPLPAELAPRLLVSGSSEAGRAAARAIGATPVEYPPPELELVQADDAGSGRGVRVGVIARESDEEAWSLAFARFPPDRKGQLAHRLAMSVSDSSWHRQLAGYAETAERPESPYWLVPFQNYKTFCPYLVGGHDRVAEFLGSYLRAGCDTFILDVPFSEADLEHTRTTFDLALRRAQAARPAPGEPS
jgi:alkanesulfonate monooxygenase